MIIAHLTLATILFAAANFVGFADQPTPSAKQGAKKAASSKPAAASQTSSTETAASGEKKPASPPRRPYINDKGGYSIQLPPGWKPKPGDAGMLLSPNLGEADFFTENLRIIVEASAAKSPEEYLDQLLPTIRKSMPSFKELERRELEIDGRPAVAIVYTYEQNFLEAKVVAYLVSYEPRYVALIYTALTSTLGDWDEQFEESALSFRFRRAGDPSSTPAEKMPAGPVIHDQAARFQDPQGRYSFMLPESWTQKPQEQSDAMFVRNNVDNENRDVSLEIKLTEDPAESPVAYLEKILPLLRKSLPAFQEVDRQKLRIDGKPAVAIVYTANVSDVPVDGVSYFVSNGQQHARLTFTTVANSYLEYLPEIRVAALSFRFNSKTPLYQEAALVTWRVPDGKNVSERVVNDLQFGPSGIMLSSATDAENVIVWGAATGKPVRTLKGHTKSVTAVEYFADGNSLVSASHDSTIRIWDLKNGKQRFKMGRKEEPIGDIALSPDGKLLASTSWNSDKTHLWNVIDGKHVREIGHSSTIVTFDREGKVLAMTKSTFDPYGTDIELWDVATGKLTQTLKGHRNGLTAVIFSVDNKTLISCATEAVIFWDLATGKQERKIPSQSIGSVLTLSPNGKVFAFIESPKLRFLDATTTEDLLEMDLGSYPATCVAFSPDGKRLATGYMGREIRIWDISKALPAAATPANAPK